MNPTGRTPIKESSSTRRETCTAPPWGVVPTTTVASPLGDVASYSSSRHDPTSSLKLVHVL
jgi:hypothetical protein